MPLPDRIVVRLSSEAAGSISMTPVIHQSMPVRDVVELVLATTGKDVVRVREVLMRGSVVQGASRFRWEPLAAEPDDVTALLQSFPDPDPQRPFRADACTGVRLHAGRITLELPREVASRRRFLKRRSFWDALMELAAAWPLEYIDYLYRARSDEYRLRLTPAQATALCQNAALLAYSTFAAQIREHAPDRVEYRVRYP